MLNVVLRGKVIVISVPEKELMHFFAAGTINEQPPFLKWKIRFQSL